MSAQEKPGNIKGSMKHYLALSVKGNNFSDKVVTYALNQDANSLNVFRSLNNDKKLEFLMKAAESYAKEVAKNTSTEKPDETNDPVESNTSSKGGSSSESKYDVSDLSDVIASQFGNFDDIGACESEVAFTGFRMNEAITDIMSVENDRLAFQADLRYLLTFLFTRGTNVDKMRQRGTIDQSSLDKVERLISKYNINSSVGDAGPTGMTFTRLQAAFPLMCFQILKRMNNPPDDYETQIPPAWRFPAAPSLMYDIDGIGKTFYDKWAIWCLARSKLISKGSITPTLDTVYKFARTNCNNSIVPLALRDPKNAKFLKDIKPP